MKIEWEYELVEKPFCQQLRGMGWDWIEGDPDLPESTGRTSSREVILRGRLADALRRLNLRDGNPWLDEGRIAKAIKNLEQAAGHRLMEAPFQIRSATGQHRRHGGVSGGGKGRGQGL